MAYGEYLEGMKRFWRLNFEEAMSYFDRAIALDSSFMPAIFFKSVAHMRVGQLADADSIAQVLDASRTTLTPVQNAAIDVLVAMTRGRTPQ
jgi:Tfp pilus assembly protein PilF